MKQFAVAILFQSCKPSLNVTSVDNHLALWTGPALSSEEAFGKAMLCTTEQRGDRAYTTHLVSEIQDSPQPSQQEGQG